MALTCGNEGSTAGQIVEQINLNEENISLNEVRITTLEEHIDPRGSLRLGTSGLQQTVTDNVVPTLLVAFDATVTARGGITVDPVAHSITYVGSAVESAIVSIGLNVEFPGTEELEVYLYVNDTPYSDTPINLQGMGAGKPTVEFWQSDMPLANGDVLTLRGRNADIGTLLLTYLRTTFRVDIN